MVRYKAIKNVLAIFDSEEIKEIEKVEEIKGKKNTYGYYY